MYRQLVIYGFSLICLFYTVSEAQARYRTWGVHAENQQDDVMQDRYISFKVMGSNLMIKGIENGLTYDSTWAGEAWNLLTPTDDSINEFVHGGAAAIGFQWRILGQKSLRTELEATARDDLNYNVAPIYRNEFGATNGDATFLQSGIIVNNYMLNFYYDFMGVQSGKSRMGLFTPYIGLGLGVARNKTRNLFIDTTHTTLITSGTTEPVTRNHKTSMAYAGMLGFSYHFTENLAFDLSYRLSYLGKIEWTTRDAAYEYILLESSKVIAQDVLAGLRISF